MRQIKVTTLLSQLRTQEFIVLENVWVTYTRPQYIIGRWHVNECGDSFMRLEQAEAKDVPATEETTTAISLFTHHSCGFGHAFHSMLSSYSRLLTNADKLPPDYQMLHFSGTAHTIQLNALCSEIEGREMVILEPQQRKFFRRLIFFKHETIPTFQNVPAVNKIRQFIPEDETLPERVAILKTDKVRKLDNFYNPRGNLNAEHIQSIFKDFDVHLIDHAELGIREIIQHIISCKYFITNWGATSAWHSFLKPPQKCYCIVPQPYAFETTNQGPYRNLCFNPNMFAPYKLSSRPVSNFINDSEIKLLRGDLKAFFPPETTNP
jgi:hypothetical protein